ncbi:MAG TPA: hypothetical protein VFJ18_00735 [Pararhizobium sp.]|nr:hypothetical protein [Pararhizobium sp.]
MSGERNKPQQDPVEGAPDIVDEELQRQSKDTKERGADGKRERPQEGQNPDGGKRKDPASK